MPILKVCKNNRAPNQKRKPHQVEPLLAHLAGYSSATRASMSSDSDPWDTESSALSGLRVRAYRRPTDDSV